MKPDKISTLEEPEKVVLNFLIYLEKKTPIRFNLSTLTGKWTWVTSTIEGITVSMPTEFYTVHVTNYQMAMVLRYCPCEYCHKVVYVELIIDDRDPESINAHIVRSHINNAVPDMKIYINSKPELINKN
jgi:hypothetical protein